MGVAPIIPAPRGLDAEQQRDIERFERAIAQYLAGEISEDVFRVMRLNNGIYGQRQGGTNQMVRIKLPAGTIKLSTGAVAHTSTRASRNTAHPLRVSSACGLGSWRTGSCISGLGAATLHRKNALRTLLDEDDDEH